MLKRLTELCLTRQTLVLMALVAFLGAGILAFLHLNIEAYPDPSPPMLEIITQSPGQSAEEMERYITIPIEVAIAGMPGLLNFAWFVAPYTRNRELSISAPVLHRTQDPRSSSALAMASPLPHLFPPAMGPAALQAVRGHARPLPSRAAPPRWSRGDVSLPAGPATLPLDSAGLPAPLPGPHGPTHGR
jgi:cobalt-zinc-cadmium resistance protein CzcA